MAAGQKLKVQHQRRQLQLQQLVRHQQLIYRRQQPPQRQCLQQVRKVQQRRLQHLSRMKTVLLLHVEDHLHH